MSEAGPFRLKGGLGVAATELWARTSDVRRCFLRWFFFETAVGDVCGSLILKDEETGREVEDNEYRDESKEEVGAPPHKSLTRTKDSSKSYRSTVTLDSSPTLMS